jgi:hypothetical protein
MHVITMIINLMPSPKGTVNIPLIESNAEPINIEVEGRMRKITLHSKKSCLIALTTDSQNIPK